MAERLIFQLPVLTEVTSESYLGILFDTCFNFGFHIAEALIKTFKILFSYILIERLLKSLCFSSTIIPILKQLLDIVSYLRAQLQKTD